MTILLVDDEPLARTLVKTFLQDYPSCQVVGEAGDGFQAVKMIQELKPDLVFLDIQMPRMTGFEVLDLLIAPPTIVFATAYDQFAMEAFDRNALDYLLKPFSRERFRKTMDKVLAQPPKGHEIREALWNQPVKTVDRVVVKQGSKIEIIPLENLTHIEADGDYVWLHTAQGQKFLKQKTMKALEAELPATFVRTHRSFLVNADYIQKVDLYEKNSYQMKLKTGATLSVSRQGYKVLREQLGF
ncbi:MAG: LytR/AlgR family response regulator transcription factor [Spirosomataceae bacterium]